MPQYEVKMVWQFSPGMVEGSTEMVPKDLLDEDGHMMNLAEWPRDSLVVDASDNVSAATEAQAKRGATGEIYVNSKIGVERIKELTNRERPGSEGRYTSVNESWIAREQGKKDWLLVLIGTHPTLK